MIVNLDSVAAVADVIVPYLERIPETAAAYIFGSLADGSFVAQHSDIDIAVLFTAGQPGIWYQHRQLELSGRFCQLLKTDAVDVVVMNIVRSSELKYQIVHDGRVIFNRTANLAEYELWVEHEYFDHLAALRRSGLSKQELPGV